MPDAIESATPNSLEIQRKLFIEHHAQHGEIYTQFVNEWCNKMQYCFVEASKEMKKTEGVNYTVVGEYSQLAADLCKRITTCEAYDSYILNAIQETCSNSITAEQFEEVRKGANKCTIELGREILKSWKVNKTEEKIDRLWNIHQPAVVKATEMSMKELNEALPA